MRHHAPVVVHPVGRTPALAWALAGLWLTGGLAVLAWLLLAPPGPGRGWRVAILLAALLAAGGGLWHFWRTQAARELAFDGATWHLSAPGTGTGTGTGTIVAARVRIALDGQHFALLRLEKTGPGRTCGIWLWAEAGRQTARWHRLRCALYSSAQQRPPSDVTDGSPPP